MSTRALAIQLGLLETINIENELAILNSRQTFDYLFVLDFEATCWDSGDVNKRSPEVIEFSVILYDVKDSNIVDEFQQYVMPMEVPKLSEFCKKLTGIQQCQVDGGVPLPTCLMVFMKWLRQHVAQLRLVFPGNNTESCAGKKCMFVTWTDWDLGTCLANECKRKRIKKPTVFNQWADLKALYKEQYGHTPKGLNGALSEMALSFEGKEHCGLDDARNTARLAAKMIASGIQLHLTKIINV